jgi:hypothetical protein
MFTQIDAQIAALQESYNNANTKNAITPAFLTQLDWNAATILAASFEHGEPWFFHTADYAFERLCSQFLANLDPTTVASICQDDDRGHSFDKYPFLRALVYFTSEPEIVDNKEPPREFLLTALGRLIEMSHARRLSVYTQWAGVTLLLMLPKLTGPAVRSELVMDNSTSDTQEGGLLAANLVYDLVFRAAQWPQFKTMTTTAKTHQLMYRARALGLWNFDVEHVSIKAGLNYGLSSHVGVADFSASLAAELCLTHKERINKPMAIDEFDTILAILVQSSAWQKRLETTLILSATASQELVHWLSGKNYEREYAPPAAAQQQFHWFMNNPDKANQQLVLIPFLDSHHFVCGGLWWEEGARRGEWVLQSMFIDSRWTDEFKKKLYESVFSPFLNALAKVFGIAVAKTVTTFDPDATFAQDGEGCGHIVMALLALLMDHKGLGVTPHDRVHSFFLAIREAYAVADTKIRLLEVIRENWVDGNITHGIEWKGRIAYLRNLELLRDSGGHHYWPHTWFLESPFQLIEFIGDKIDSDDEIAAEGLPVELLVEPSVVRLFEKTVRDEWRETDDHSRSSSMPWAPPPRSAKALLLLACVRKRAPSPKTPPYVDFPGNPFRTPTDGFIKNLESDVGDFTITLFNGILLGPRFPRIESAAATLPYWQTMARIEEDLSNYLNNDLSAKIDFAIGVRLADATDRARIRAILAQAQTPLNRQLPADTLARFTSENVLAALWPTQFCWLDTTSEPATPWLPTHWLDSVISDPASAAMDQFKASTSDFLRGLADCLDIQPYENMGAHTGPVIIMPKPYLASFDAVQQYVQATPAAALSWRTIGAVFATRHHWQNDTNFDPSASIILALAYKTTQNNEYEQGKTETELARNVALLASAIRFVDALVKKRDLLADPRLHWLTEKSNVGIPSPLSQGIWAAGGVKDAFLMKLDQLQSLLENDGEKLFALSKRNRALNEAVEKRLSTLGQQVDDLKAIGSEFFASRYKLILEITVATERYAKDLDDLLSYFQVFGAFPTKWRQVVRSIKSVYLLMQESNHYSRLIEKYTDEFKRLEGEKTAIERRFELPAIDPLWQEYFRLPVTELDPDRAGSGAIQLLQKWDYETYRASPFGSFKRRTEIPPFFADPRRQHFEFLDKIDAVFGKRLEENTVLLERADKAREENKSDYSDIEMMMRIFKLAQGKFKARADVDAVSALANTSDVLALALELTQHLFSDDETARTKILSVWGPTFSLLKEKLAKWTDLMQTQLTTLGTELEFFAEDPASVKIETWFRGYFKALQTKQILAFTPFHEEHKRCLAIFSSLFGQPIPVDSYASFLAKVMGGEASDKVSEALEKLSKSPRLIEETTSEKILSEFLRVVRFISEDSMNFLAPENKTWDASFSVSLAGCQKYLLVCESGDVRGQTQAFRLASERRPFYAAVADNSILIDVLLRIVERWLFLIGSLDDDSLNKASQRKSLLGLLQKLPVVSIFQNTQRTEARRLELTGTLDEISQRLSTAHGKVDIFRDHLASTAQALKLLQRDVNVLVETDPRLQYKTIRLHDIAQPGAGRSFRKIIQDHNDAVADLQLAVLESKNNAEFWETWTTPLLVGPLDSPFRKSVSSVLDHTLAELNQTGIERIRAILYPRGTDLNSSAAFVEAAEALREGAPVESDDDDDDEVVNIRMLVIEDADEDSFTFEVKPFKFPFRMAVLEDVFKTAQDYQNDLTLASFSEIVARAAANGNQLQPIFPLNLDAEKERQVWIRYVRAIVTVLEYSPFMETPRGGTSPEKFFDLTNRLMRLTSATSLNQVFADFAVASFRAFPNTIFNAPTAEMRIKFRQTPLAFFADPTQEDMLAPAALQTEIYDWVLDTLEDYNAIPTRYIQTDQYVLDEIDALTGALLVQRVLSNGNTMRFYVPTEMRAKDILAKGPRTPITDFPETTLANNLVRFFSAMLERAPLNTVPKRVEDFRKAIKETDDLITEALRLEMDRVDTEQNWHLNTVALAGAPGKSVANLSLSEFQQYAAQVRREGATFANTMAAFRQKIGPLSFMTLDKYEHKIDEWRDRLDAGFVVGALGTKLMTQTFFIHLKADAGGYQDPATVAEEAELAKTLNDLADSIARDFRHIESLLANVEQEMGTIRQRNSRVSVAAEPATQAALAWTTSRFYRSKYADEGSSTRKPWLLATDDSPASLKTIAKFGGRPPRAAEEVHLLGGPDRTEAEKIRAEGGRRPTDLDEILAATVFSEDHRAQVEKAERARLDFYTEAQRDREHYRAVRELAKQERERQRKMPVPWKRK